MKFFVLLVTCYLLLVTFPPSVYAQTVTEAATPSALIQPLGQVSPQSPQYANLLLVNIIHAFSCLAEGTSIIDQPCLEYLSKTNPQGQTTTIPVLASLNLSGGLLGSLQSVMGVMYTNPPVRSINYLASLGESLGIVKEAQAQVGGSGRDVLSAILDLWRVSRNIAYIVMILIFVVVGLMVVFRNRINPQTVITVQAALPGLVIGLILITFSYFLAALLTDLAFVGSNLVGHYFLIAQGQASGQAPANLLESLGRENVLSIFSRLIGAFDRSDLATGVAAILNHLQGLAATLVQVGAALLACQIGAQLGQIGGPIAGGILGFIFGGGLGGVPAGLGVGNVLGGPAGCGFGGVYAFQDLPGALSLFLYFILAAILIYAMFRVLFRLVTNYLSIIFLTVSAPFHFLFASLPGRQEVAVDWVRNMLCNILSFPAVLAVFYFAAYLIGPTRFQTDDPFRIGTELNLTGAALPLFGGLDQVFIRLLLAYGALIATPAIPEIICRAIGKVGVAGQLIGQEIGVSGAGGRGYLERVGGVPAAVFGPLRQVQWPQFRTWWGRMWTPPPPTP